MQPKLTISLVTWNSSQDLPNFFESLKTQSFQDFELLVVDNHSIDDSLDKIKDLYPEATILPQSKNLGYGAAHNIAIAQSKSPFHLVLNADLRLGPDFIARLLEAMEQDDKAASAGGKLLKLGETSPTIDSAGLEMHRSRRVTDRGEGEPDQGQYDSKEEIWGISGAACLFRKSALEQVKEGAGEYYDARFFMYKEDVDLAWRLQKAGWKSLYVPSAVAYHRRSAFGRQDDLAVAAARKEKSKMMNYYSYRNHLLTLFKNETTRTFLPRAPWIIWYELKKLAYLLFFEPKTLRAWGVIKKK
ncbi:MAG: glycosyltransferase family 2 protein [bacterium]|nr:glycosyltransferase family 2 protein [bacterium]